MQIQAALLIPPALLAFCVVPVPAVAQDVSPGRTPTEVDTSPVEELPVDTLDIEDVYRDDDDIEVIIVRGGSDSGESDFGSADSTAAFSAADLAALGAQNIADLASFTPNLEVVTSGATSPTFFIRGVGLNDFNANSTSAVSIVENDVVKNSPALQLGTLFDVENVKILRGPQGSGNYRSASAGAIKIYHRRPTGTHNGNLSFTYGNFGAIDLEGALGGPVFEDILAARVAFRFSDRDGYGKNGCGGAPPRSQRNVRPGGPFAVDGRDPIVSQCGEFVEKQGVFNNSTFTRADGISKVPAGLPSRINNQHNWGARGMLLFQPTLDQEWLFTVSGAKRDELTRLGQSYGTSRPSFSVIGPLGTGGRGVLGSADRIVGGQYTPTEVTKRRFELDPCIDNASPAFPTVGNNTCFLTDAAGDPILDSFGRSTRDQDKQKFTDYVARQLLAKELAQNLDTKPYRGDYNRVGSTSNETWGLSIRGDLVVSNSVHITSVSGYDHYDRLVDNDTDQTPNVRFESVTSDDGWQFFQSIDFESDVSEDVPFKWGIGGLFLYEELNVRSAGFFEGLQGLAADTERDYQQLLWSGAVHAGFSLDFWEKFSLDGGLRYNWERKSMAYELRISSTRFIQDKVRVWQAPTGSIRLTYNFTETAYAYWKYARGWKGGHYNATSSPDGVTNANPENVDSFELGLDGSWFQGRLGLDVSMFHYTYQDYQLFTSETRFGANPEFVTLNASDAEVYGAEIDLRLRPIDSLFLRVSASWLESQFLDYTQIQVSVRRLSYTGNIVQNNEVQNSGNPLLNSPQFKLSMTAEQTVPLGRLGSLAARWDGAWTASTNYDATNARGLPNFEGEQFLPKHTIGQRSYWLHNVRLSYRLASGSVELAAWVRNVENFAYKNFAFDATLFNDTAIFFLGEPRTYGLTLTSSF